MSGLKWTQLTTISGRLDAEILKSFLESQDIEVQLFQEGAGQDLYPVSFGPLSMVQVFVPDEKLVDAKKLLDEFNRQSDEEAEIPDEE